MHSAQLPSPTQVGEGPGVMVWTPPFSDGIEVPKWESVKETPS